MVFLSPQHPPRCAPDGGLVRLRNARLQRLRYAVEMPRAEGLDVAGRLGVILGLGRLAIFAWENQWKMVL